MPFQPDAAYPKMDPRLRGDDSVAMRNACMAVPTASSGRVTPRGNPGR